MEVNKIIKKYYLVIALILITIAAYIPMLKGFFQQDEWFSYGWYVIHKNLNFTDTLKFVFYPNVGHYNPFIVGIQQFLFGAWGLNYLRFGIIGIVLHVLVVLALFYFVKIVFKGEVWGAFLVSLFFSVLASSYQGVAWVVTDISTLSSSLLGVLSAVFFFRFLNRNRQKELICSLILLFLSLFFKEITLGLFPLYLICILFIGNKKTIKKNLLLIFSFGFLFVLIRAIMFFIPNLNSDQTIVKSESLSKFIYNFLTFPIKTILYSIFPEAFFKVFSVNVAKLFPVRISGSFGSPGFEVFVVKRVMEFLAITFGSVIVMFGLIVGVKNRKNVYGMAILLGVFWAILNSFIFSISPQTSGVVFVPDSRNLYFSAIGICLFIVSIVRLLTKNNMKLVLLIFVPLIIFNFSYLRNNLNIFTDRGVLRKQILDKITTSYPKLNSKVIFYTESTSSYYGLPEKTRIMPFQSGFGQVLLARYESKQNFPVDFFKNDFLWNIDSQGYMEKRGIGFGYYRDFKTLAKDVSENKFDNNNIISYSFDNNTNSLTDISNQVRGRIEGYETQKKIINPRMFSVATSQNLTGVNNMIDGNINTNWNSALPISNYQYIIIDMKRIYDIVQLTIDSYNNQNQNEVGYRILVSKDDKTWENVFESKKYPPEDNGKDEIYFKPTESRFIRIEQIGKQKFAPWVINELEIYGKI